MGKIEYLFSRKLILPLMQRVYVERWKELIACDAFGLEK